MLKRATTLQPHSSSKSRHAEEGKKTGSSKISTKSGENTTSPTSLDLKKWKPVIITGKRAIYGLWGYIVFCSMSFLFAFLGIIDVDNTDALTTLDVLDRLCWLTVLILVIRRAYKAYKNLQLSGVEGLHFQKTGWLIRGWLIIIANRYMPYQIVRDLFKKYYQDEKHIPRTLLGWWWGLWVVSHLLITYRPEDDESGFIFLIVIGFIVSCFLLIQIIKKLNTVQQEILEEKV